MSPKNPFENSGKVTPIEKGKDVRRKTAKREAEEAIMQGRKERAVSNDLQAFPLEKDTETVEAFKKRLEAATPGDLALHQLASNLIFELDETIDVYTVKEFTEEANVRRILREDLQKALDDYIERGI